MDNRLDADAFDAALHLLDRQVIDVDGLLVCKVDDLELSFRDSSPESPPSVTRILTGTAALLPRLSNRSGRVLRERWRSLGIQYAQRDVPLALDLSTIRHLGSAVELHVKGEGLLDRQPPPAPGTTRRRMGELLGLKVHSDHPEHRGRVLDVRVRPVAPGQLDVTHLLLGPGRPGALLGYDRNQFDGPWLVRSVLRLLHRHLRLVAWSAVQDIDWDAGTVALHPDAAAMPVSLD